MLRAVFSKDCWFLRFTALLHRVIPACQGNKPCLDSHIVWIQPTKTAWLFPVRPHWTQNMQHHVLSSAQSLTSFNEILAFYFPSVSVKLVWSSVPHPLCSGSALFSRLFCFTLSLLVPLYLPCSLEKVSTAEPPSARAGTNPALLKWGTDNRVYGWSQGWVKPSLLQL